MHCEKLEDYICRLLSEAEVSAFETHLVDCDHCRGAAERDRQLFAVLHDAVETLELCPATLVIKAKSAPATGSRRTGRLAVAASLAALALLAVVGLRSDVGPISSNRKTSIPEPVSEAAVPPPMVLVRGDGVSFPLDSGDPNIQIVMINASTPPHAD